MPKAQVGETWWYGDHAYRIDAYDPELGYGLIMVATGKPPTKGYWYPEKLFDTARMWTQKIAPCAECGTLFSRLDYLCEECRDRLT